MVKIPVEYLVGSDLHAGAHDCGANAAYEVLQKYDYKHLIIVGDLFEDVPANQEQCDLIGFLRSISSKVIYIDGNHDPLDQECWGKFINVQAVGKFECVIGGKRFLFVHGHKKWDQWHPVFGYKLVDKLSLMCAAFFKRLLITFGAQACLPWFHHNFERRFKKQVSKYAIRYGFDVIVCGHIHMPCYDPFPDKKGNKREYVNCGSFKAGQCSFVTIDPEGGVTLHVISPG